MKAFLATIGVCAGLSACALEGDDVAGDDATSSVTQASHGGCETFVCGANSPCLSDQTPCDGFFHELPMMIGAVNDEGFEMRGMHVAGVWYNLSVVDGELTAVKAGYPTISGAALINKVFRVRGPDGTIYLIKIKGHSMQAYSPAGTGFTHAYRLVWTILNAVGDPVEHNICSHPEDLTGEYDTLFQDKWTTVLFEGERYDAVTKTIKGYSNNFFNIGCAGNVLAKMHLSHHSSVSSFGAHVSTPAERQTMLKMYVADYCGDGSSFTVFGEQLGWKDNHGWFSYYYPLNTLSLEARWGEDGPVCLESPRLTGSTDPAVLAEFPLGIDAEIDAQCGPASATPTRPPTCSSLGQTTNVWQLYGNHLASAYPH